LEYIGPLSLGLQLPQCSIQLLLQEGLVAPQFLDQLLMYRGM